MTYFDHHYISNSDLKKLAAIVLGTYHDPADLKEIFDFGNLVENVIFQPHLADYKHPDIELAYKMRDTYMADDMCRQLLMVSDFRPQHEWYRSKVYDVAARCKADGDSKKLSLILEFKGLAVDSDKAFEEAINHFHYDQGLCWYLDVSGYQRALIVAVSKKSPNKLFKRIIDRNHPYYKSGKLKVEKCIRHYKTMFEPIAA